MADERPMRARIFLAPAGSEIIGMSAEGVPIAADKNGAGEMTPLLGVFRGDGFV